LAGGYYQEIPNGVRNRAENSRGTLSWIADFRRLFDGCVAAESEITSSRDICQAFQILFALLDRLDDETAEEILFAEECGSWMVGIEWTRVLPAWFRVLAFTAEPTEYTRRVEAIINRLCHGQEAEMLTLARSVEASGAAESSARRLISTNRPGHASALGAEGRGFESLRPDQHKLLIIQAI
jgi:hypothetical protein